MPRDYDDFQFELNGDGTATVVKYRGGDVMPVVPDEVDGCAVTGIGDWAFGRFFGKGALLGIKLPESITSIGEYAFSNCKKLSVINIPTNVTFIGAAAFSGCASLLALSLPSQLTDVKDWLFKDCRQLVSAKIPYGVRAVGKGAFSGCHSLTEVFLPDDISVIEFETFRDCKRLAKLDLPPSVTRIGDAAFKGCYSLAHLTVPHRVAFIGADAFPSGTILHAYPGSYAEAFAKAKRHPFIPLDEPVQEEEIPSDVIAERAFSGDKTLTDAVIPEGITEIGNGAYADCALLEHVDFPESLAVVGIDAFSGTALKEAVIPAGVTKIGWNAFPPGTLLRGEKDGYVQAYAQKNKYAFEPVNAGNVDVGKPMLDVLKTVYGLRGRDAFSNGQLFKNLINDLMPGKKNAGARNVLYAAVAQLNVLAAAERDSDPAAEGRLAKSLMDLGYQPRLAKEAASCFWRVLC